MSEESAKTAKSPMSKESAETMKSELVAKSESTGNMEEGQHPWLFFHCTDGVISSNSFLSTERWKLLQEESPSCILIKAFERSAGFSAFDGHFYGLRFSTKEILHMFDIIKASRLHAYRPGKLFALIGGPLCLSMEALLYFGLEELLICRLWQKYRDYLEKKHKKEHGDTHGVRWSFQLAYNGTHLTLRWNAPHKFTTCIAAYLSTDWSRNHEIFATDSSPDLLKLIRKTDQWLQRIFGEQSTHFYFNNKSSVRFGCLLSHVTDV
jgi:hypothetical protein